MVSKTTTMVKYIDDLDGSEANGPVFFAIEGQLFEIDLSQDNKNALLRALRPYVDAGRKVRSTKNRTAQPRTVTNQQTDARHIRSWARDAGIEVSQRGRIPNHVINSFQNSMTQQSLQPTADGATVHIDAVDML